MDSLNISYTEESFVLTQGKMSFTLYENTIWPILGLCTVISRRARLDVVALCLAYQTLEPEDQDRYQDGHL